MFNSSLHRLFLAIAFGMAGLACLVLQYRGQLRVDSDTVNYSYMMLDLVHGQILKLTIIWPPGWPALALPLYVLGLTPLYAFITVAGLSFVVLIWCAGEILYPRFGIAAMLVAYVVIAFEPVFSVQVWPGLTDIPFVATLAVLLYLCLREISLINSILIGVVAAIACYLRYPGLFLLVAVPVLQFARCWHHRRSYSHIAFSLAILVFLIVPIFARNYLASGQVIWTAPVRNSSLVETSVLWLFHHFRAALLFRADWLDWFLNNNLLTWALLSLGTGVFAVIAITTLKLRRDLLVVLTFLLMTMYAGAMVLPSFHVETRYLLPEIFCLLIWLLAVIEYYKDRYPRFRQTVIGLLLIHTVAAAFYMAILGADLRDRPDVTACVEELTEIAADEVIVADDVVSKSVSTLTRKFQPIIVSSIDTTASLTVIRSTRKSVVLAAAVRGSRGSTSPVFTPWANQLKGWSEIYPDEFKIRHQGRCLLVVDYSHSPLQ